MKNVSTNIDNFNHVHAEENGMLMLLLLMMKLCIGIHITLVHENALRLQSVICLLFCWSLMSQQAI